MQDLISRQQAIDVALTLLVEYCGAAFDEDMQKMLCERLDALPSAQPEKRTEERTKTHACDCISRKAAIDALRAMQTYKMCAGDDLLLVDQAGAMTELMMLPSAYPETDGFCTDCKEYDQDRHFCPRFDRVIKKTVEEMGIIHCKDCKHGELFSDQYLCRKAVFWREGDFYCGYAERRTNERTD